MPSNDSIKFGPFLYRKKGGNSLKKLGDIAEIWWIWNETDSGAMGLSVKGAIPIILNFCTLDEQS